MVYVRGGRFLGDRGSQLQTRPWCRGAVRGWRSPSGATEDRNAGIALKTDAPEAWRSPPGATEDCNSRSSGPRWCHRGVAVAPRGDQGSQRIGSKPARGLDVGWRSPSGATEGRNNGVAWAYQQLLMWRSPSGVIEDRNNYPQKAGEMVDTVAVVPWGDRGSQQGLPQRGRKQVPAWRSLPEQPRIATAGLVRRRCPGPRVADAFWGDRGSHPRQSHALSTRHRVWRSLPGAAEDRNRKAGMDVNDRAEWGRPRIATSVLSWSPA